MCNMIRFSTLMPAAAIVFLFAPPFALMGADSEDLLKAIRAVEGEGKGNPVAARAWKRLVETSTAADIPAILAGMDGANPLVANWIRGVVDVVAERGLERGETLPVAKLEVFVLDTHHASRARRLAFEWLSRVDKSAADRIIPGMLDDPSVEFRRDAVARLLREAETVGAAKDKSKALALYKKALVAARDPGQIGRIAKALRELGEAVDLPRHFGFLVLWMLIGPFDNTRKKGHDTPYGPEKESDLKAEHTGKKGQVTWREHTTRHDYGLVDLNKAIAHEKAVIAYARAEFTSDRARDVELGMASQNGWKLWLNGKLLFARGEYHRGTQIDHFRIEGRMKAGNNIILVKVCQNEQTQSYADPWRFQLRVCDATGTAILSTTRDAKGGAR